MAVILKKIKLRGSRGEVEKEAIFDSGATYSCIHSEPGGGVGTLEPLPEPMEFTTAEEGRITVASGAVRLNFT